MNFSDIIIYFWLIPVLFQILLPLTMCCGWVLFKLPALLFARNNLKRSAQPAFAH